MKNRSLCSIPAMAASIPAPWAATTRWKNSSCSNSPRLWARNCAKATAYSVVFTREDDTLRPARRAGANRPQARRRRCSFRCTPTLWPATARACRAPPSTPCPTAPPTPRPPASPNTRTRPTPRPAWRPKRTPSDVNDILFDLTRRETRAYSHVFAHSLAEYWKVAARLNKNPSRSAGFVVLKAPDVPSVLLELGYLSNDADAADLSSPEWREKAAAQVGAGDRGLFRGASV